MASGQELVSGDWKLTFTDAGHVKVTKTGGQTTFYYMDPPISGATQLFFNDQCHLELRDDHGDIPAAYYRHYTNPDSDRPSYFILGPDGVARIFVNGEKVWRLDNFMVGSSPDMPSDNNILRENSSLRRGEGLTSSNGRYRFAFQNDGNLVMHDLTTKSQIWSMDSEYRQGTSLDMKNNGDLVLYEDHGLYANKVWASGTGGKGMSQTNKLIMQNNGILVIYTGDKGIWSNLLQ